MQREDIHELLALVSRIESGDASLRELKAKLVRLLTPSWLDGSEASTVEALAKPRGDCESCAGMSGSEHLLELTGELRQAKLKAELANDAKTTFLANMSHEIRTPLNVVLGFCQLMAEDESLSRSQRMQLQIITGHSRHLLELINSILEVSKIESGQVQIELKKVNLQDFLEALEHMMRAPFRQRGLSFEMKIWGFLPKNIRVDEGKLRQILLNLVDNACKFINFGGAVVGVTAERGLRRDRGRLIVEISDTAPAIEESDYERIFEAFQQLAPSSQNKGVGLGLTVARRYARAMSGDLTLRRAEGRGNVFRLELPVEVCRGHSGTLRFSGLRQRPTADDLKLRPRVLIVDDEPSNLLLMKTMVGPLKLDIQTARNGAEALSAFAAWTPQLVLLDIRMPGMSGLEVMQALRKRPESEGVLFIAVSASAFEADRREAMRVGFDEFVSKPIERLEFLKMLADYLKIEVEPTTKRGLKVLPSTVTLPMSERLPEKLFLEFRRAIVSCDLGAMRALLPKIGTHGQDMVTRLRPLLDRLDFDAIEKLFQCQEAP